MTIDSITTRFASRACNLLLAVAIGFALNGCDTNVTNPGPVQDVNLDDPGSWESIVNGAARMFAQSMQWNAFTGGVIILEARGGGNITDHGVSLAHEEGRLGPEGSEGDEWWEYAQQARWLAEEAARRIRDNSSDFSNSAPGAEALLWAGFANRNLGENMCVGVIDGGAAQDRIVYHQRAEPAFTEAMEIFGRIGNTQMALAAQAGRAATRVWLGDWTGAMADAASVPKDFKFVAEYFDVDQDQHNRMYFAIAGAPFRSMTIWDVWYETYANTGDPRVTTTTDPDNPFGTKGYPFVIQTKYTSRTSPIDIADGREMLLIRAEGHLRANELPEAVALLNEIRNDVGLPDVTPATLEDGWTALRQERAVEFWLEARQLGDVWRWEQEGTPGTHIQEEAIQDRDRCFVIGQTEINTNPNITGPTG